MAKLCWYEIEGGPIVPKLDRMAIDRLGPLRFRRFLPFFFLSSAEERGGSFQNWSRRMGLREAERLMTAGLGRLASVLVACPVQLAQLYLSNRLPEG